MSGYWKRFKKSSIDDFKRGERGRPAKEVSDEIRDRLGLGDDGVSS